MLDRKLVRNQISRNRPHLMTMAVIYTIALTTLDVKATISWSRPVDSLKKSNLDNTWYRQDMQLQYPSWPHHGDYVGMAEAGGAGGRAPPPPRFRQNRRRRRAAVARRITICPPPPSFRKLLTPLHCRLCGCCRHRRWQQHACSRTQGSDFPSSLF